ncbi:MAG TPA: UpxY family transcription antiterminator [Candidatus Acidoferrum sp.]|nr:UpxY family transcription antiterminator [Candidatus Acidoferrum sp.]
MSLIPAFESNVSPAAASVRALQSPQADPHWYAAYTCANHEKQVAAQLEVRAVEHFLPVYSSVRRWKDRRVTLDLPLFPGYVFIRLALSERMRVLEVPGVVRLVGFSGRPATLPDEEMEILRTGLGRRLGAEPHPFLTVGRRVRITGGPFAGLEGVLKRKKSALRVVVSLELIQRSVAVDVDLADVQAMASREGIPPSPGVFRKCGF